MTDLQICGWRAPPRSRRTMERQKVGEPKWWRRHRCRGEARGAPHPRGAGHGRQRRPPSQIWPEPPKVHRGRGRRHGSIFFRLTDHFLRTLGLGDDDGKGRKPVPFPHRRQAQLPAPPNGAGRTRTAALREGELPIASRVARARVPLRETHLPLSSAI
jgi:hypothetical protein